MVVETGTMIFLYGPPGSGKSQVGAQLSEALGLTFMDLDSEVTAARGETIAEIFARLGEEAFRSLEREALDVLLKHANGVVSLGGGALLDPESRRKVEQRGHVLCLNAPFEVLADRLAASEEVRPLLRDSLRERLGDLLEQRSEHYASIPIQLNTDGHSAEQIAWEAQIRLGIFYVRGMGLGYDVHVLKGGLDSLGDMLVTRGLKPPIVLVSDEQVASHYAQRVVDGISNAGRETHVVVLRPGEQHKNLASIEQLWREFTQAGVERSSCVVALGGGVIGDLAGFAAATYVRGVAWVCVPTSLLAMVDASLGGKTGFDLPSGKNLVGAFHPPRFVLADLDMLQTLPEGELRNGMAEVVKHAIIADPRLFEACAQGLESVRHRLDEVVRRAAAVKIGVIQADPYEQNERAKLNLGHTLGHAIEHVSGYRLRHGEAVAIGMVAATRLSERIGVADRGLADTIAGVLGGLGLPTQIPTDLPRERVIQAMKVDKKRFGGVVRWVLPVRIGEVISGMEVEGVEALIDWL